MSIQSDPLHPIPGDVVSLTITSATGTTTATRFEFTSIPENSALDTGMLLDAAGDATQEFTPDVAGAYAVTAYDYRRFSGAPAYAGDPAGEARDLLVATQSGTIYVGDVMDLPIRGAGHEVTLRLTVVNGTVRAASLENPTTDVARYATLDTTVLAAVGDLEGEAAASLGESIVTDVAAFTTAFNAHLSSPDAHPTPGDTVNPLVIAEAATVAGAIRRLNELGDHYYRHLVTDDVWHEDTIDLEHLPIVAKATDVAGAYVYLAEMRRVYPAHINDIPGLHPELDEDSELTANSLLTTAIIAVLDYFASESPTSPAGENPGAVSLAARYGFAAAA